MHFQSIITSLTGNKNDSEGLEDVHMLFAGWFRTVLIVSMQKEHTVAILIDTECLERRSLNQVIQNGHFRQKLELDLLLLAGWNSIVCAERVLLILHVSLAHLSRRLIGELTG